DRPRGTAPPPPPRERGHDTAHRRRHPRDAPSGSGDDRRRDRPLYGRPPARERRQPRSHGGMKSDDVLLAIDAGTGSCRALAFDLEGNQLAIGQREYSHSELPEVPGSQVFDTDANWKLICACIREVLAEVSRDAVRAVSATSMREGMV